MARSATTLISAVLLCACSSTPIPDRRELAELVQSGPGGRIGGDAQEENYVVIGDGVAVVDNLNPEELTVPPQIVDIDGTIELPLLGSVNVAGMTQKEIEAHLTAAYARFFEGAEEALDIKARITSRAKFYYVFGEIQRTGRQILSEETTMLDAVMGAGPKPDSANLSRCRLIRGDPLDPLIIIVDLNEIVTEGNSTFNILVRERDIIWIPPTWLAELGFLLRRVFFPVQQVLGVANSLIFTLVYAFDNDRVIF